MGQPLAPACRHLQDVEVRVDRAGVRRRGVSRQRFAGPGHRLAKPLSLPSAYPAGYITSMSSPHNRLPRWTGPLLGLVLLAATGLALFLWVNRPPAPPPDEE